jgi:hypothetical protein
VSLLVVTSWRLESSLRLANGSADAGGAAERALERAGLLLKAGSADSKIVGECAQAHVVAGRIAEAGGQRDLAQRHWQRVLEIINVRPQESNDWRLMDPAARALAFLGRVDESRAIVTRLHARGYRPLQPWPEVVAGVHSVSPTQNKK